jgi:transposase
VDERVRVISNLQTDLQAVCPGLLEITKNAGNQWFLNFLLSAPTLPQLARLRPATLLKIPAVGKKYAMLIAKILLSIPGFGTICSSELAGEIGTVERFSKEGSLALYLGMSTLDNSSGKYQGSKQPKHVNTRAKAAMMVSLDRHRKYVPQSQRYYENKRSEGKKHNQAIRALGRHLCRIIYKISRKNGSTSFASKRAIPRAG